MINIRIALSFLFPFFVLHYFSVFSGCLSLLHMKMYVCVCTSAWRLDGDLGCLLQSVSVLVSETGALPEAISHHLNRITEWWAPCIPLSLLIPLHHLQGFRVHYHTQVLYMGLGEPNSSFYACVASTLQTGQSLYLCFFVFYCFKDV